MKRINTSRYAEFGKYSKREKMVRLLKEYGIRDKSVLNAFLTIPRHCFIPDEQQEMAYRDQAVQIGYGQTISQPYVVALMLEQLKLKPAFNVLEIGSGSGYVLALLSLLVKQVKGIELEKDLVKRSKETLNRLKIGNAEVICGDGYSGYSRYAPYDAILLSAAPDTLPEKLLSQLKPSGKLILPVGRSEQLLVLYERFETDWKARVITEVQFVPLRK